LDVFTYQHLLTRLRSRWNAAPEARELAAHWRAKYEALRVQFHERQRQERGARETLKAQSDRRARRIPSVETLQHMLRVRTPLAQRRAAGVLPPATEPPRLDLNGCARRTVIDGLTWWVPVMPSQSARSIERMMLKQRLPYLAIGQTRDVAVGGVMLDIGANVGRMAIPRVILGDSTRVYCAEADEVNYRCLVANIRDNCLAGLVTADRVAISDRVGLLPLERRKMSGSHRVVYTGDLPPQVTTVPCTTLDTWVERQGIDLAEVTFIKVDTQGSELHVLGGASRTLGQAHIAWQIEIAPGHLRLAGSEPQDLYCLLTERFSHFFDMNPEASGPRVRPIAELCSALEYLEATADAQTDIVLYRAAPDA
jgi:FkbM family methyltransferase